MGKEIKLIQEKPFSGNALSVTIVKDANFCNHLGVEIDEDAHVVTCTKCGKVIDPFTFLNEIAKNERVEKWHYDELKEIIKRLRIEHADLERQVTNLKAQKRRLEK